MIAVLIFAFNMYTVMAAYTLGKLSMIELPYNVSPTKSALVDIGLALIWPYVWFKIWFGRA